MEIRQINKSVEEIIGGGTYLGSGASKEAYSKNNIVYKIPRGRYLLQEGEFGTNLHFPSMMEEVDYFLEEVSEYEEALVWPLGQFAIELIVWKAIEQLESEGLEINCFARIKDYYLDKKGVIVIEQEKTTEPFEDDDDDILWNELVKEICALEPILKERFNISLRDVRSGNCGKDSEGRLKLFDFGISTTTSLDSWGSYSDYCNDYCDEYNSYEGD